MNLKIKCSTCDKFYLRKSSLEKHKILCEYLNKTKREKFINEEESKDIPTYNDLVNIVQELSIKYVNMMEKMERFEKWIDKKKKKINIIDWLNKNQIPNKNFDQWIYDLKFNSLDIEFLHDNSIFQLFNNIWQQNSNIIPISCFIQKQNILFIYNSENKWKQMQTEEFLYLLQKIQNKLIKELISWREDNLHDINNNDSKSILYNKIIIKIMNISLVQDNNYSKLHANLYNYLKMDLKNIMEYEFEF